MSKLNKHIVIVGPTASSKSSVAISLAQIFECEIISLDSMQIYKGFEIGTGCVTRQDQHGIRHHMLSFNDLTNSYNAKFFGESVNNILSDGPKICISRWNRFIYSRNN